MTQSELEIKREAIIQRMSLKEKVGQMFVISFNGKKMDEKQIELFRKYKVGNFILYSNNIGDKDELIELNKALQKYSLDNYGVPCFISVDQEGGNVNRFTSELSTFPGAMATAAAGSEDDCEKLSELLGQELNALGFNINFAPVCDINTNPMNPVIGSRAYGDTAEVVSKFAKSFVRGHKKIGIFACSKHFPGHGSTVVDSHSSLPVIDKSIEEIMKVDIVPFKEMIDDGVDLIMVAHLNTPFDEEFETSQSPKIVQLLREKLGFNGMIITDSMIMGAISTDSYKEACANAVRAGFDLICSGSGSNSIDKYLDYEPIDFIVKCVQDGNIPIETIDNALRRIIDYKLRLPHTTSFDTIDLELNRRICSEVSHKSITIARDEAKLIPLEDDIICFSCQQMAEHSFALLGTTPFNVTLSKKISCDIGSFPIDPSDDDIRKAVSLAKSHKTVVIAPHRAAYHPKQGKLLRELFYANKNIILVSLFDPYEVLKFPEIPTVIVAYEISSQSINSTIDVLVGKFEAKGKLPFVSSLN